VYLLPNATIQASALKFHNAQSKLLQEGDPNIEMHLSITEKIRQASKPPSTDMKTDFSDKIEAGEAEIGKSKSSHDFPINAFAK